MAITSALRTDEFQDLRDDLGAYRAARNKLDTRFARAVLTRCVLEWLQSHAATGNSDAHCRAVVAASSAAFERLLGGEIRPVIFRERDRRAVEKCARATLDAIPNTAPAIICGVDVRAYVEMTEALSAIPVSTVPGSSAGGNPGRRRLLEELAIELLKSFPRVQRSVLHSIICIPYPRTDTGTVNRVLTDERLSDLHAEADRQRARGHQADRAMMAAITQAQARRTSVLPPEVANLKALMSDCLSFIQVGLPPFAHNGAAVNLMEALAEHVSDPFMAEDIRESARRLRYEHSLDE